MLTKKIILVGLVLLFSLLFLLELSGRNNLKYFFLSLTDYRKNRRDTTLIKLPKPEWKITQWKLPIE